MGGKQNKKRIAWNKGVSKYANDEEKKAAKKQAYGYWKLLNKDRINENSRKYYHATPKSERAAKHLYGRYGITLDDYCSMLEEQQGCCAICRQEKTLVVDHCHDVGRIRGLLCDKCNRGLGCFEDDVERLERAVLYLIGILT